MVGKALFRFRAVVLMGISMCLGGCVATVQGPGKPKLPEISPFGGATTQSHAPAPQSPAPQFMPNVSAGVLFVPKEGTQPSQTVDGVTIQVASVVDGGSSQEENYRVTIEGPDGSQHIVSLFPRVVRLKVTNGTDHIVPLGQTAMLTGTVIHLEDEQGREIPLLQDQKAAVRELSKQIEAEFDQYGRILQGQTPTFSGQSTDGESALAAWEQAEKKKVSDALRTYKTEYDSIWPQAKEKTSGLKILLFILPIWYINGMQVEFPDRDPIQIAAGNEEYSKSLIDRETQKSGHHPDTIEKAREQEIQRVSIEARMKLSSVAAEAQAAHAKAQTDFAEKLAKVTAAKARALAEIGNLPSVSNVIYSGEYPPIRVLPGKSAEVLIPFAKSPSGQELKELAVGVIDVPTQFDSAGVATKRAAYSFKMVPTSHR